MQKNLSNLRIRNDILREKSAFFNFRDVVCFMIYLFFKDKRPFYQLYSWFSVFIYSVANCRIVLNILQLFLPMQVDCNVLAK